MGSLVRQKPDRTRVMIVDDHTLVRIGLTDLINRDDRFDVVGEADSCASGLELVYRLMPDIVILDTELSDASGCSALKQLHSRFPDIALVIYSSNQSHRFVDDAFKHHVSAYVLKSSPLESLMHAMQTVLEGMEFIDPDLPAYMPGRGQGQATSAQEEKSLLTDREQTILSMLATGKANKEIANELFITERTVKFHVSAILKRLKVKNRTQAVRVATEMRLLDDAVSERRQAARGVYPMERRGATPSAYLDRRGNSGVSGTNDSIHPHFERRSGYERRKMDRCPTPPYLQLASFDKA